MTHDGLPVAGYQPQSARTVELVNQNKHLEELVLRKAELIRSMYDGRWAAVAITHFEQGFMALNRAVFQPKRIVDKAEQQLLEHAFPDYEIEKSADDGIPF